MSYTSKPLGRIARTVLNPPGWPLIGFCVAVMILNLWGELTPRGNFGAYVFSLLGWSITGGALLARSIAMRLVTKRFQCCCPRGPHYGRWLTPMLLFASTIVLVASGIPSTVAYFVSRPAMERLARQTEKSPRGTKLPDQRLGLYWATNIEKTDSGLRFELDGCNGFMDWCGFAHLPEGLPSTQPFEGGYEHWDDQWYVWYEVF